ncbi:MAG: hypothetical protein HOJ89_11315, partial [Opitutales bacterium]|nr:hypothetical protein [Opitutales bacterium]
MNKLLMKNTKLPSLSYDTSFSRRSILAGSLALAVLATPAWSQDSDDDIIELSPFSVSAADETGYRANSTLAGTRLKTNLGDLPNSITVA